MEEAGAVDGREAGGGVEGDVERLLPAEAYAGTYELAQIDAVGVLHDEVPDARDGVAVEDAYDVRVVDAEAGAGLIAQALRGGVGRALDALWQDLHNAGVVQELVLGVVGEAVRAASDQLDQAVAVAQDAAGGDFGQAVQRREGVQGSRLTWQRPDEVAGVTAHGAGGDGREAPGGMAMRAAARAGVGVFSGPGMLVKTPGAHLATSS